MEASCPRAMAPERNASLPGRGECGLCRATERGRRLLLQRVPSLLNSVNVPRADQQLKKQ